MLEYFDADVIVKSFIFRKESRDRTHYKYVLMEFITAKN